jgi:hypothetical protein
MNTAPASDDRELRDLLRSWDVESRSDPELARRVWAQIDAEQPRAVAGWLESLSRLLARPAAALAAIALFAALGAVAGELKNSQQREAQVSRLAAEYARSIDPILMTHPANHAGHSP